MTTHIDFASMLDNFDRLSALISRSSETFDNFTKAMECPTDATVAQDTEADNNWQPTSTQYQEAYR